MQRLGPMFTVLMLCVLAASVAFQYAVGDAEAMQLAEVLPLAGAAVTAFSPPETGNPDPNPNPNLDPKP